MPLSVIVQESGLTLLAIRTSSLGLSSPYDNDQRSEITTHLTSFSQNMTQTRLTFLI